MALPCGVWQGWGDLKEGKRWCNRPLCVPEVRDRFQVDPVSKEDMCLLPREFQGVAPALSAAFPSERKKGWVSVFVCDFEVDQPMSHLLPTLMA